MYSQKSQKFINTSPIESTKTNFTKKNEYLILVVGAS